MKVTLIDYTHDAISKLIYTKATRLTQGADTHMKIRNMSEEDKQRELAYIARTNPGSWEFVSYTFEILGVTRAFTHQFVRTRTGSYAQQTMRMLPMEEFTYETGPSIKNNSNAKEVYDHCMGQIQRSYEFLLDCGIPPEDARGLLPTNIHTNIIAQFSLRSLSDLVRKRRTARTQNEYHRVVVAMVEAVIEVHPWAMQFLCSQKLQAASELESKLSQLKYILGEEYTPMLKLIDELRKD